MYRKMLKGEEVPSNLEDEAAWRRRRRKKKLGKGHGGLGDK